jgi:AcrR family transcriptional regulator
MGERYSSPCSQVPPVVRTVGDRFFKMASTSSTGKSPRVPKAEAISKSIEAVISLSDSHPVSGISDQMIADTAGINRALLYRYFGTRLELFDAVVDVLTERWIKAGTRDRDRDLTEIKFENLGPLMEGATKLFAIANYLLAADYQSDRMRKNFGQMVDTWADHVAKFGITPRMARSFAYKILALRLAQSGVGSLVDIPPEVVDDVYLLTITEMLNLKITETALGWDTVTD